MKSVGERHEYTATARSVQGRIYQARGESTRARAELSRALESMTAALGEEHPTLASFRVDAGLSMMHAGARAEDAAAGEALARQGIEQLVEAHGVAHPYALRERRGLAGALAARGRAAEGIELLEQNLVIATRAKVEGPPRGAIEVELARALRGAPGQRSRAEALRRAGLERLDPADPLRALADPTR